MTREENDPNISTDVTIDIHSRRHEKQRYETGNPSYLSSHSLPVPRYRCTSYAVCDATGDRSPISNMHPLRYHPSFTVATRITSIV
eukprot:6456246-Pyramimonas_sp.AAC.1